VSNFDLAVMVVLKHERGYVDNPADRGGPTNMGITLPDLTAYLRRDATLDDIKNLTPQMASNIYRGIWDKAAIELLADPRLALVVFDQVVLCGPHAAICRLQTALGNVACTGVLGQQTRQEANNRHPMALIAKYLRLSAQAYMADVKKRPAQFIFLGGWIDRLWDLQEEVSQNLNR
jgi:lysozyme family protein